VGALVSGALSTKFRVFGEYVDRFLRALNVVTRIGYRWEITTILVTPNGAIRADAVDAWFEVDAVFENTAHSSSRTSDVCAEIIIDYRDITVGSSEAFDAYCTWLDGTGNRIDVILEVAWAAAFPVYTIFSCSRLCIVLEHVAGSNLDANLITDAARASAV